MAKKGNKTTINEHRRRKEGLKSGQANDAGNEPKDRHFDKKPKVDREGDEGKLRYVKKSLPYNGKDLPNRGTQVTRREYTFLNKLYTETRSMQIHKLEDIVFFYKVLTSAARHMGKQKLEAVINAEGDALVISTHKFLRMYNQRFIVPPKRPMDNATRERYQTAIRDYTVRDGLRIPGKWFSEARAGPISTRGLAEAGKNPKNLHQVKSSLNGNNGESTNADDVQDGSCDHPWCNGIILKSSYWTRYYFQHLGVEAIFRLFDNVGGNLSYAYVDDEDCDKDECEDCYCLECVIETLHNLHIAQSQLNGVNGEATNSDDVEGAVFKACDPSKLCRKPTHGHAKVRSGAERRIAEAKAKSDQNKPPKEVEPCIDIVGNYIVCAACPNPTTRYHSVTLCAPCFKAPDAIRQSLADSEEEEQGNRDGIFEAADAAHTNMEESSRKLTTARKLYYTRLNEALYKSDITSKRAELVSCLKERFIELETAKLLKTSDIGEPREPLVADNIIDEPGPSCYSSNTPQAVMTTICGEPILADNSKAEPIDSKSSPFDIVVIDDYWRDTSSEELTSLDGSSDAGALELYRMEKSLPLGGALNESIEIVDILINTNLQGVEFDRTWMGFILKIFGEVTYSPKDAVKHTIRDAVLYTTENIDMRNSFLSYFMYAAGSSRHIRHKTKDSVTRHDLLDTSFYNATIKREIFTKLYEKALAANYLTPIGAYDRSKPVYAYFLARAITAASSDLDPFYSLPENIMRTVSTWMYVANSLVVVHSNYNKIQPERLNLGQK